MRPKLNPTKNIINSVVDGCSVPRVTDSEMRAKRRVLKLGFIYRLFLYFVFFFFSFVPIGQLNDNW